VKAQYTLSFLAILCAHVASAARISSFVESNKAYPDTQYLILDTAAIHALYMDGEFESAIGQLEHASGNGLLKSHADSVFAYKHLGVMYAAQYETMERGKNYMYRLLGIEPSVKILDMYASEMIYMIFRNVQAEYQIRTARPNGPDSSLVTSDSTKERPSMAKNRKQTWHYWTAGAIVLAGAGAAAYFLVQDNPTQPNHFDGGF
jgi:hypothetical protein